ncbi:MAG: carotenoid biosynthesis protein [Candidatus Rokubacteria bacterium]|nr:carotenoid biosynthesis protein [Candidatus Rokubacteria bacterium]
MALFVGSLLLRPYVFLFLLAYLAVALRDLGGRRTLLFTAWVWPLAFLAEFSSTRTGIPFGLYHYTGDTRDRELFIADVPFFDSLSFVFLAYAAYCVARTLASSARPLFFALAGGVSMMLLDVVIDPIAVRGDQWFLGRIFWYAEPGYYFGVPVSNFAGWALLGALSIGGYLLIASRVFGPEPSPGRPLPGVGLYYGVLLFNLAVTAWIGEWSLLLAGVTLHLVAAAVLFRLRIPSRAGAAGAAMEGRS